jgi:VanZ family protein
LNNTDKYNEGQLRKILLITGWLYVLFVIYGSLVPLEFQARPMAEAWQAFLRFPYQKIDFSPSADRDANILLYIPLGFLITAWLGGKHCAGLLNGLAALLVCVTVSVGVEFTQLFFPLRTSSLNDIIANSLGGATGVALWSLFGARFMGLLAEIHSGGPHAVRAVVIFYVTAYLTFSLFPYDFLFSTQGLAQKLGSDQYHLLIAASSCASLQLCGAKLAAEVVAAAPLGILMGMTGRSGGRPAYSRAWAYGLLLGLVIEVGQFFLASGNSQGISVITRAGGMLLGLMLFSLMKNRRLDRFRPHLGKAAVLCCPPYLVLLAALNGWFTRSWLGLQEGLQRVPELHFVPFYYHYYTTETAAMFSLLAYAGMYAPVGLGTWAWMAAGRRSENLGGALFAGLLAAGMAFAMEAGKLFIAAKRPDPTDLLIAAVAASAAFVLATMVSRWVSGIPAAPDSARTAPAEAVAVANQGSRLLSLMLGTLIGWAVLDYPLGPYGLGLGLAVYVLLLWRFPRLWLIAVPALVPVLDLAPWSGWMFLDELDLVILATVAVGLWRPLRATEHQAFSKATRLLVSLFAASYAVSLFIGLMPLQPLDDNAFSSYLSHYNSLRVAKGFFLALLLLPLLKDSAFHPGADYRRLFSVGVTFGVALLAAVVLWERWLFPGLFDFSTEYRVTALFSGMQTGGPQVEAYVALVLPFVAVWFLAKPGKLAFAAALLLFAAAAYAVLVTFARGGYLALAVVMLVLFAGLVLGRGAKWRSLGWRRLFPAVLALIVVAVAVPVVTGTYIQSRFSQTRTDLGIRLEHWKSALGMIGKDGYSRIFGMGLGTFPATYYLENSRGIRPGNFRFRQENGNTFLRLGGGDSYYIGQKAAVTADNRYLLSLDMRSAVPGLAKLEIYLCEKHVLYSFRCKALQFVSTPGRADWEHRELVFNSGEVGRGRPFIRRPVQLAFVAPAAGALIDVDNVRLIGPHGADLIANGNFSHGAARWFFTTDDGWPWRVENLWLQFLFEQGWLGVLAFSLLIARQCYRLARQAVRGDVFAVGLLASFSGLLTVGLFGSVFESPRLATLFFIMFFVSELHLRPERIPKSRPTI